MEAVGGVMINDVIASNAGNFKSPLILHIMTSKGTHHLPNGFNFQVDKFGFRCYLFYRKQANYYGGHNWLFDHEQAADDLL